MTTELQVQNSSSDTMVEPGSKKAVIDRVFTQVGFDQFFLENAHEVRQPHCRIADASKPLILHVDDDVDLVDAVTSRLRANGFRVACALDGVSGVQAALAYPADAIVLDYDMPNDRGDVVLGVLKNNERTRNIPVVVLTAIQKKSLKRRLLSMGADVFMTKPFDFEVLQETILTLIENRDENAPESDFGNDK